jgi:Protein of unknown function (DUF2752)
MLLAEVNLKYVSRSFYQIIVVSIAVITLSLLYFFYPATNTSFHPKCIFHELTGLYCPGCGSQRAASSLLHGNILQAIDYNILFVLALPFVLYSAYIFSWNAFSRQKKQQLIFHSPVFVKTILIVVILFGILRNLPLAPFNWLAP